jgi:hypothetical protein
LNELHPPNPGTKNQEKKCKDALARNGKNSSYQNGKQQKQKERAKESAEFHQISVRNSWQESSDQAKKNPDWSNLKCGMRFGCKQIMRSNIPLPHLFDHAEITIYVCGIARKNTGPFAGSRSIEKTNSIWDGSNYEREDQGQPERAVDLQDT